MDIDVNANKTHTYPHVCGVCALGFDTEAEYLAHVCSETGYKPSEPEHLGKQFLEVSKRALERGNLRRELEARGVKPEEAKVQAFEIQQAAQAKPKPSK